MYRVGEFLLDEVRSCGPVVHSKPLEPPRWVRFLGVSDRDLQRCEPAGADLIDYVDAGATCERHRQEIRRSDPHRRLTVDIDGHAASIDGVEPMIPLPRERNGCHQHSSLTTARVYGQSRTWQECTFLVVAVSDRD
jgi:hypothetical protein